MDELGSFFRRYTDTEAVGTYIALQLVAQMTKMLAERGIFDEHDIDRLFGAMSELCLGFPNAEPIIERLRREAFRGVPTDER